jgi:hypothetical protein
MIDDKFLEYAKLTIDESLLDEHFPEVGLVNKARHDLLLERVPSLQNFMDVNSELEDAIINHKSNLAIAYPGLVTLPDNMISYLSPETLAAVGVGLAEEEVKKNAVKFHVWFTFNELEKDPKCIIRLENTRNVILLAKKHGIEIRNDYLFHFISLLNPLIDEKEAGKLRALSEIQSLKMHHEIPTKAKAIKMWRKSVQEKLKEGEVLSKVEKDNKNKDLDYVVKSMVTALSRELKKRKKRKNGDG